eukprot:GHVN01004078.1.p1 GENE.GHVN01004078.1~~GHVN01004078.1.p1  ORF type:complete len:350 (-),score=48.00 GHVN01004078.1:111-1160(-)
MKGMFKLFVFTNAIWEYAWKVMEILDPDNTIFEKRLMAKSIPMGGPSPANNSASVNREPESERMKKDLGLVLQVCYDVDDEVEGQRKQTIIIDDKSEIWGEDAGRVIVPDYYAYFDLKKEHLQNDYGNDVTPEGKFHSLVDCDRQLKKLEEAFDETRLCIDDTMDLVARLKQSKIESENVVLFDSASPTPSSLRFALDRACEQIAPETKLRSVQTVQQLEEVLKKTQERALNLVCVEITATQQDEVEHFLQKQKEGGNLREYELLSPLWLLATRACFAPAPTAHFRDKPSSLQKYLSFNAGFWDYFHWEVLAIRTGDAPRWGLTFRRWRKRSREWSRFKQSRLQASQPS